MHTSVLIATELRATTSHCEIIVYQEGFLSSDNCVPHLMGLVDMLALRFFAESGHQGFSGPMLWVLASWRQLMGIAQ